MKYAGWGGPFGHLTGVNRQFATFVGIAGGIHFPEVGRGSIFLGAAFDYLVLPLRVDPDVQDDSERLNMNYAGLVLGGAFARAAGRLSLGLWGLLGGGGGCLQNQMSGECRDRNAFFVAEPELFLHIMVHRSVTISLAAGYRFVASDAWAGPGSWRLAGPVGTLGIVIGKFE